MRVGGGALVAEDRPAGPQQLSGANQSASSHIIHIVSSGIVSCAVALPPRSYVNLARSIPGASPHIELYILIGFRV
eukprot:8733002-Pyramimonas_sp.AAC.1